MKHLLNISTMMEAPSILVIPFQQLEENSDNPTFQNVKKIITHMLFLPFRWTQRVLPNINPWGPMGICMTQEKRIKKMKRANCNPRNSIRTKIKKKSGLN